MSNLNTTLATLAEQKDFLAIALIRFLDLCGGADGTECGRGDPRVVRGLAVAALDKAGIAYGKSKVPLPGLDDAEHERQKGTLHAGGIRTPGFVSDPASQSRDPRDDWMDNGGRRIRPVAIVPSSEAPNNSRTP